MRRNLKSLTVVTIILFWILVCVSSVWAEIGLGGKVEINVISTVDSYGEITVDWQEHLNMNFFLPRFGNTSAKFEMDLYYEPQSQNNKVYWDVKKLYIKHRFEKLYLTLGRQPISWSFGSLVNPIDFTSESDLMGMIPEKSENAVLGYIPFDWKSNLTVVAAFPESGDGLKWGLKGRTEYKGFDLTYNYVWEAEQVYEVWPEQRIGVTGKGDLGQVGVYGAVGYYFKNDLAQGQPVYLIGADYSFDLDYGSKVVAQLEYIRDETGKIQPPGMGFDLLIGLLSYEIDEFASAGLITVINPKDKSLVLMPNYSNLIGEGLDFTLRGAVFIGDTASQFGPKKLGIGYEIPRGIIQMGFSYSF
ncbi:hypothetical protein BBF96_01465 [Anoxybacter fermentans]|uniref:Porin domain-containing protein n=1 Tax=Anoxybacter fermentans TaxID=1323375 RepID=A0A3Q9HP11_9FIRM|nr:hypothetical protein [Anoxybacter fermentans]AZR72179.1 hypothetical protein BBF96_01465 [Anoxybacter fermentans]